MRATITDANVLQSLEPSEVTVYLHAHNWQFVERFGPKGAVWTAPLPSSMGEGTAEVLLPLDRGVSDYSRRMAEVVEVLGVVENRSQLDVVRDINDVLADVVRLRFQGPTFDDGSVPLEAGENIVQQARAMMTAAACAVVQPRAVYGDEVPSEVVDYMKRVRLGQTEHGSFVMTIRSVLPVRFLPPPQSFMDAYPGNALFTDNGAEPPFERRVTLKLAEAIQATQEINTASTWNTASGTRRGVSANFCESVAGLLEQGVANELSVSVNWASVQMPSSDVIARPTFIFPASMVPRLNRVAEAMRSIGERELGTNLTVRASAVLTASEQAITADSQKRRENFSVKGTVIRLARDRVSEAGVVTVLAPVDNAQKRIKISLSGKDYLSAVEAHKSGQLISVEGTLIPGASPRSVSSLENPQNFTVPQAA